MNKAAYPALAETVYRDRLENGLETVSYTHLTLPTKA